MKTKIEPPARVSRNRRARIYDTHRVLYNDVYNVYHQLAAREKKHLKHSGTYLNELYRDRRFSDTTTTDDDELVGLCVALSVRGFRHLFSLSLRWVIFECLCIRESFTRWRRTRDQMLISRERVLWLTAIMGSRRRLPRRNARTRTFVRMRIIYVRIYMIHVAWAVTDVFPRSR